MKTLKQIVFTGAVVFGLSLAVFAQKQDPPKTPPKDPPPKINPSGPKPPPPKDPPKDGKKPKKPDNEFSLVWTEDLKVIVI